jgi:hypothetical protein
MEMKGSSQSRDRKGAVRLSDNLNYFVNLNFEFVSDFDNRISDL